MISPSPSTRRVPAGTSSLDFWAILEIPVNCGKAFIDSCFWDFSRLL
jgi:hypothetical protein